MLRSLYISHAGKGGAQLLSPGPLDGHIECVYLWVTVMPRDGAVSTAGE